MAKTQLYRQRKIAYVLLSLPWLVQISFFCRMPLFPLFNTINNKLIIKYKGSTINVQKLRVSRAISSSVFFQYLYFEIETQNNGALIILIVRYTNHKYNPF